MPEDRGDVGSSPLGVEWERRPVLRPFGEWAAFGVRDPSLLLTSDGAFHTGKGVGYTMFFNARDRALDSGGVTVVGRATSQDGEHWTPDPDPILQDGRYAAQGSAVLLDNGEVLMPYSPDTRTGFRIAKAQSPAAAFEPIGSIVLRPADVGCTRIGLPFLWQYVNVWHMHFEGISHKGRFVLLHAWSEDLLTWEPDQRPIFQPPEDAWDGLGQANPSVHTIAGTTSLLYNGSSVSMEWDVGCATKRDGQWIWFDQPILRRMTSEPWSATRLEGARLAPPSNELSLLYFGTPTHDPYSGATIGLARHV